MDASFCQPRQSGASLLIVAPEIILAGNTKKLFLFPCHEQPTAGSLNKRFVSQKHISDELAVLCSTRIHTRVCAKACLALVW